MKLLLAIIVLSIGMIGCSDKEAAPAKLCTDPCLKDSLKFRGDHDLQPYVYVLPANCAADTIVWSHKLVPRNKKIVVSEYTDRDVMVSPNLVQAYFTDTSHVWLLFNDCNTSRGFAIQLPYDTTRSIKSYKSALNRIDPKYNVAEGLVAYADYTFVYVQDMNTGKTEQLKLSDTELTIDFNQIHNTFDSIFVTRNRIYVKMKGEDAKEKAISL